MRDSLLVDWEDGVSAEFSYLWLRDNARDPISFDSRSNQRELYTAEIPADVRPASAEISEAGNTVMLEWQDISAPVAYPAEFLRRYSGIDTSSVKPILWAGTPDVPRLSLDALVSETPEPGGELGRALAEYGFAVITDCPTTDDTVAQIAGFLGYVRETIFGGIWHFEANEAMADSAYTPKELRPHTDGTYSLDAPGVQILLCVENEAEGGQSIMVDGFQVAENIRKSDPDVFEDLCRIEIEGCYQGDGVQLRARRPVVRMVDGKLEQITFNNYDRAPMYLPAEEMERMYRAIGMIDQQFNDHSNQWRYSLQAGEALVFDNWRVLHGRSAFSGRRHMCGAYVNREDVQSFQRKVLQLA